MPMESLPSDFNYSSVVRMLLYLAGLPPLTLLMLSTMLQDICSAQRLWTNMHCEFVTIWKIPLIRDWSWYLWRNSWRLIVYPMLIRLGCMAWSNRWSCLYKSRTEYVIMVACCPIKWQYKLQSETTLSIMEAEIIALAHSCCELFLIMDGVSVMGKAIGLLICNTTIQVLIHTENAGAHVLA